jgi:hypothetical protein
MSCVKYSSIVYWVSVKVGIKIIVIVKCVERILESSRVAYSIEFLRKLLFSVTEQFLTDSRNLAN